MNKSIIIAFLAALSVFSMHAEDPKWVIVMEDGTVINAEEVEIGKNATFYQIDSNSAINKIENSKILVIKNSNGEKWMPDQQTSTPSSSETSVSNEPSKGEEVNYSDQTANERLKNKISPSNVSYTGSVTDKQAGTLALLYGPTEDSTIADKNLQLIVKTLHGASGGGANAMTSRVINPYAAPTIQVELTNISDKTVYIDLANTFLVADGNSHRYYTPTATSSGVSSTSGGSVNLGAVAGAMGIGGAAGRVASGINVGGSTGQTTTTTVFSERIQAIPPHATITLEGVAFPEYDSPENRGSDFGMTGDGAWKAKRFAYATTKDKMLNIGQEVTDPAVMAKFPEIYFTLDYSLDEGMSSRAKLSSRYAAQRLIGLKSDKELGSEKDSMIYIYLKPMKK